MTLMTTLKVNLFSLFSKNNHKHLIYHLKISHNKKRKGYMMTQMKINNNNNHLKKFLKSNSQRWLNNNKRFNSLKRKDFIMILMKMNRNKLSSKNLNQKIQYNKECNNLFPQKRKVYLKIVMMIWYQVKLLKSKLLRM